tara:strand:- start:74 stop:361 length:288 start_codon:yes stop_codon:yes gene_type:complete
MTMSTLILGIGMAAAVLSMFASTILVIYSDIRRRRAIEERQEAELQAEYESNCADYEAELEAELEDRYHAEREHSEQYREWQAGGRAPSGRLSQF